ncbi:MAG: Arylsulfatase [Alphaproteobacteria bacterium MarineAlpha10_Bin3]|nr:MAG: Arylsulfatase [Alphaproteobacteria bacterium MarineAlpha10_Bin3]PPR70780.1 MAG: Arylsulfatase [Alphaproteobacteria bacterium MarineAlpha4_Bin1]
MGKPHNILFIMADQLRADYLSCAGHPSIQTPHIDALAARGVRFGRAVCQAPICGPSRMSFYTGRYLFSHGSTWNNVPLNIGEWTMGDYLRPLGMRTVLVGKTHFAADTQGMARLGVDPASRDGILFGECGFEPFERDDGLHTHVNFDPDLAYNVWLRERGYAGDNPWHDFANSAQGPDGEILSGWEMRHAPLPARLLEEHSETSYMTGRAIDFIDEAGDAPWCLHLSYIKPHWPYVAPAPYNSMYGPNQVLPANRRAAERDAAHPVMAAFMNHTESHSFQREAVRQAVIPVYMGLISQIDAHLGRLFAHLAARGRLDDTMIVFTSDHGDYLGDHWLGEKELFHDASVAIPMILVDPDPAADATRGSVDNRLVEAIDLLPTFVDALGGDAMPHRLEGRSLLALTRGRAAEGWRDAVFAEADYAWRAARLELNVAPHEARAIMVRTDRWKYVHFENFRPQLFDLAEDPGELCDLGASDGHAAVRAELHERIFAWLRARRTRTTISDDKVVRRTNKSRKQGFIIGEW